MRSQVKSIVSLSAQTLKNTSKQTRRSWLVDRTEKGLRLYSGAELFFAAPDAFNVSLSHLTLKHVVVPSDLICIIMALCVVAKTNGV